MLNARAFVAPGNESPEHFLLKNVAVAYLRLHFGCTIAAMEVMGMSDSANPVNGKETKYVADAVGIKIKDQWLSYAEREEPSQTRKRIETVYCIEVKVSRNDFRSGYCIGGDLNYVMTPKGLVDKGELYRGVGLIEVDLDALDFDKEWKIQGVEIAKRATTRRQQKNDEKWIDFVFRDMARQLTLNSIRNNPWFYPGWSRR